MELKEEIKILLKSLDERGHDRAAIETALARPQNYLDQALSRKNTDKKHLLAVLRLYEKAMLHNATPNSASSERRPIPVPPAVLEDLKAIQQAAGRIAAALTKKEPAKSDIQTANRAVSTKLKKGKQA